MGRQEVAVKRNQTEGKSYDSSARRCILRRGSGGRAEEPELIRRAQGRGGDLLHVEERE